MSYRYSGVARSLHWFTAVVTLLVFGVGIWIVYFEPRSNPSLEHLLYMTHESTGAVLFVLIALRLLYRLSHPPAPLPRHVPAAFQGMASATHGLLYGLLLMQPVIGFLNANAAGAPLVLYDLIPIPSPLGKSSGLSPLLSSLHWYVAMALLAAVAAHLGGVFYHGILRRDGVVRRML